MTALQDGAHDNREPNALAEANDGGLTLGGAAQDAVDDDAFDWSMADEANRAKASSSCGGEPSKSMHVRARNANGTSVEELPVSGGEEHGRGKRKRAVLKRYNEFYLH